MNIAAKAEEFKEATSYVKELASNNEQLVEELETTRSDNAKLRAKNKSLKSDVSHLRKRKEDYDFKVGTAKSYIDKLKNKVQDSSCVMGRNP